MALVRMCWFLSSLALLMAVQHVSSLSEKQDYIEPLDEKIAYMLRNYQAKLMKAHGSNSFLGPPVWIGDSPPTIPPFDFDEYPIDGEIPTNNEEFMDEAMKRTDAPPVKLRNNKQHPAHRLVRSRQEPLSEEVCKTHRHWKQINETRDIYGQEVRIVHSSEFKQFAFVYECIHQGESCTGIKTQLLSTCEMRPGWAQMLHVKLESTEIGQLGPQWGYVAVPHHCACRVYPRSNPLFTRR